MISWRRRKQLLLLRNATYFECSACRSSLHRKNYSKNQLMHRAPEKRRCQHCVALGLPSLEPVFDCSACLAKLLASNYSRNQLNKPETKRRCQQCIAQRVFGAPGLLAKRAIAGVFQCSSCKFDLHGSYFSKSQITKKTPKTRRCSVCVHNEEPEAYTLSEEDKVTARHLVDGAAARRIMSAEYAKHGRIRKGSFAAMAQAWAQYNMNKGFVEDWAASKNSGMSKGSGGRMRGSGPFLSEN